MVESKRMVEPIGIAAGQVLNGDSRELPIGDADRSLIERPDAGGAQSDVLDIADGLTDL
jgi:hypothetical protein